MDERIPRQRTCVCGGRLQGCGKSKRSEASAGGRRNDSTGMPDAFPSQRFSGSVREALRLSRPQRLLSVKIFRIPADARRTRTSAAAGSFLFLAEAVGDEVTVQLAERLQNGCL